MRQGTRWEGAVVMRAGVLLVMWAMLGGCAGHDEADGRARVQYRAAASDTGPALRVCSDPNNLPFSNRRQEGFENRIAELLGRELHLPVRYTWWAQRRGFIRNTLTARRCDVVIGIPEHDPMVLATTPYYRSTYVFVYRKDRGYHLRSFDDPRLRRLRIGMHVIGDDYNALPPGVALARRHIVDNVVGYSIYGDYSRPNPPARLIDAVAKGDVDVAIAWGPLAGYFVRREPVPLEVVPVSPSVAMPEMPFTFAISLGVRHGDTAFKAELQQILERRHDEIRGILAAYGVPLVGPDGSSAPASDSRPPSGRRAPSHVSLAERR